MIKKSLMLFSLLPFCAVAHWQGHLALDAGYNHLSGYSQIPKGGNFDTSSVKRPSFSEVGEKHESFYTIAGGLSFKTLFLDLTYARFHPHGNTTLKAPLLTHAQLIPQNAAFHMDSHFSLSDLKLGKPFCWQKTMFSPFLKGDWLKYRYEFNAPPKSSERAFSAFAPGFGLKVQQKLSQNITAEAEVSATLNLTNLNVYKGELGLAYALYQKSHLAISPRIKAGLLEIDFQDNQPFPNHVRYESVPYGSVGLEIEYF